MLLKLHKLASNTIKKIYKTFSNIFWILSTGGRGLPREVFLSMKHGVEAKNYQDVSNSVFFFRFAYIYI